MQVNALDPWVFGPESTGFPCPHEWATVRLCDELSRPIMVSEHTYLKRLFPSLNNCNAPLNCEACVLAKSHKHTYSPSLTHSIKPFALIHSDVWGPAPDSNTQGFSYFVLFVNDCTRMSCVYFLKHKSEVFDVFVKFYNMIITQLQAQSQILRSDNGGNT